MGVAENVALKTSILQYHYRGSVLACNGLLDSYNNHGRRVYMKDRKKCRMTLANQDMTNSFTTVHKISFS
jgi:hypothetical protein